MNDTQLYILIGAVITPQDPRKAQTTYARAHYLLDAASVDGDGYLHLPEDVTVDDAAILGGLYAVACMLACRSMAEAWSLVMVQARQVVCDRITC